MIKSLWNFLFCLGKENAVILHEVILFALLMAMRTREKISNLSAQSRVCGGGPQTHSLSLDGMYCFYLKIRAVTRERGGEKALDGFRSARAGHRTGGGLVDGFNSFIPQGARAQPYAGLLLGV